jgi:hypothetical protein
MSGINIEMMKSLDSRRCVVKMLLAEVKCYSLIIVVSFQSFNNKALESSRDTQVRIINKSNTVLMEIK